MFCLDKETVLTPDIMQKLISKFTLNEQPKLEKWNDYYEGKHAIMRKTYKDPDKVCNRVVTNYCKVITDTYAGYIAGKPVTYTSNDEIKDVQEAINYNDSAAEDIEFLTNALKCGVAYELFWLDADAQVRYAQVDPLNAFAVYDNTMDKELLYFLRWYDADCLDDSDIYNLEVYDKDFKYVYRMHGVNGMPELVGKEPHHFGDVPVAVFNLNNTGESIFNQVITLNDAYNEIQSCEVDEWSAFCDAYLVITGAGLGKETAAEMKELRCIEVPADASVSWLTKNINDSQIENMLGNIKKNIFKITACPDMADETFLAQSGTALAYKLVGFENSASAIESRFKRAIQKRIYLICRILNIKASDAVWRDIQINFVRNLPVNTQEIIQIVNSLKGTVSDATLLAQIPFIKDVEAELEAVAKQKQENMAMFDFGAAPSAAPSDEEEVEEEEEV